MMFIAMAINNGMLSQQQHPHRVSVYHQIIRVEPELLWRDTHNLHSHTNFQDIRQDNHTHTHTQSRMIPSIVQHITVDLF